MRNILIKIIINAAALWFVDKIFTGIHVTDSGDLLITAIVFGLLNTFIKPIFIIFTLPINILTLGLFTIIINAIILQITDSIIDGFYIIDFSTAIFASVFISIISIVLNKIFKEG